jgi:exopolyphosphatase/guanosine-5'-triphosphate,3'-diphosphate pyrophosphatase
VVATAAVREAEDGPAFQAEVLEKTGLRLHVIDGAEEARLSAQGVLLGWPDAKGIVCDIGGNSMELARIGGGKVGKRVSRPRWGRSACSRSRATPKKRKAHIDATLEEAPKRSNPPATGSIWSAASGASSPGWTWSGGTIR